MPEKVLSSYSEGRQHYPASHHATIVIPLTIKLLSTLLARLQAKLKGLIMVSKRFQWSKNRFLLNIGSEVLRRLFAVSLPLSIIPTQYCEDTF